MDGKTREELQQRLDEMDSFLTRRGYRRCDIPACNCGLWHGGHAEDRLHEIYEALGGCNGTTPVPEIERLLADSERAERYRKAIEFHLNECDCGNRKCKYCDKLFVIALQEPTDAK